MGPRAGGAILDRLPLAFVENRGQWNRNARFVARRGGMAAWIEEDGVTLQLALCEGGDRRRGLVVRLSFEGALETVVLEGEEPKPGISHFFLGDDPSKWRTEVPAYGKVLYRGLQEGVDLQVREGAGTLEYDLLLAPGADLDRVAVRCEGTERLEIEADGSLAMRTALGPIRQSPPVTWHVLPGGERRSVEARFRLLGSNRFGFEVTGRDSSLPLVIDPGLLYSTFLGGSSNDFVRALALDATGGAIVAGDTLSSDFPTTSGAYDTTSNGGRDAFVARLSPSGDTLVYSTYLGGGSDDLATALALDATGGATVTGYTSSSGFPTTSGAFDTSFNGVSDAFVARLSSTGSTLLYSTFLGGSFIDTAWTLALDATGAATVAGSTTSLGFPTTAGAYDTTLSGTDAFVARLSSSGGFLLYSTFLGGAVGEEVYAIALSGGQATVAGQTGSPTFPTTPGAYDTTFNGGFSDGFVARLSSPGGTLLYSTFLGGGDFDYAYALALSGDAATVAGTTFSSGFPATTGAYDTTFGGVQDAFVAQLSASGSALLFSTFLGGSAIDTALDLALDPMATVSVAGATYSADFPTTPGSYDPTHNGGSDAFVARLTSWGGALLDSTYLGGPGNDSAASLALDATGGAIVGGSTNSPGFPTTPGAFDTTYGGGPFGVAFVARFDPFTPAPPPSGPYGTSSPGCGGPISIGVNSPPQIGNASFSITCANAPPNAIGFIGLSLSAQIPPVSIVGVEIWIGLSADVYAVSSDALGAAQFPIPIPNDPMFVGGQTFWQFFWFGPNSPSPPCPPFGLSASNALEITVLP
jgi:hypothetical protein